MIIIRDGGNELFYINNSNYKNYSKPIINIKYKNSLTIIEVN